MATVGIYEMTDTWNSGVTTYQGIKMTVTDSGSGVASTYLCACGSTGTFSITKYGTMCSNAADFGVQASPRNNNTFGGLDVAPCMANNVATGCFNTAFGTFAGCSHTTSCYSTYYGAYAGFGITCTNKACVTLLGYSAGGFSPSTGQVAIGFSAANSGTNGNCAISIGHCANACGASGNGRIGIGAFVSTANSPTGTLNNLHIGYYAQSASTSSHSDVTIGNYAMCNSQTGNANTTIGHEAGGKNNTSATAPFLNTYVGQCAGAGNAGDYNTMVGRRAGGLCTTIDSSCNTYIGYDTGLCNTVNNQIAVGKSTKPANTANHTIWGNSSNNVCNCIYAAWSTVSDCRDKTEISTLTDDYGLPFIQKLKPVSYKWDHRETYVRECKFDYGCRDGSFKGEKTNYGFIAQDIKETIDDLGISFDALGYTEEHDSYRLTYEDMIAPLTLAVQQLSNRVDVLETKKWAVCN